MLDADHGYGNALNVRRTIEECEQAGASGLSIEDTALPTPFGAGESEQLLSVEEGVGKMKAAVSARRDKSLVIAGRTSAPRIEGTEGTVRRLKAYADAGVDAVFAVGVDSLEQLDAIRAAVKLPIILGGAPASVAARGAGQARRAHPDPGPSDARRRGQGAARDLRAPARRRQGGRPRPRIASAKEMDACCRRGLQALAQGVPVLSGKIGTATISERDR